jgi:outer membrane lipoprotein-sorting protein
MSRGATCIVTLALLAAGCARAGEPPAPAAAAAAAGPETKPAGAEADTPVPAKELTKLMAGWAAEQKKLKTITARFKCTETSPLLADPQVSSGKIEIKKPDGYRRTLLDKVKRGGKEVEELAGLMILKPPHLWVYLPKAKRAEEYDLTKVGIKAGGNPLKSLGDIISFDEKRIGESFTVSAVKLADGTYLLTYLPKPGKGIANVVKVRVWMATDARFPTRIETVAGEGDTRSEEYSDLKFDEELGDELFTFKRPRGVELVKVTP